MYIYKIVTFYKKKSYKKKCYFGFIGIQLFRSFLAVAVVLLMDHIGSPSNKATSWCNVLSMGSVPVYGHVPEYH